MKKIIFVILVLSIFLLAGCGGGLESSCKGYCKFRFDTGYSVEGDLCTCGDKGTYLMVDEGGTIHFKSPDGGPAEVIVQEFNYENYIPLEFPDKMKAVANKKTGVPFNEGYSPYYFMSAFPRLENSDFNGVKANQGTFISSNGGLTHYFEGSVVIGARSKELTVQGYATLLINLQSRLGIEDEIEIIEAISQDAS